MEKQDDDHGEPQALHEHDMGIAVTADDDMPGFDDAIEDFESNSGEISSQSQHMQKVSPNQKTPDLDYASKSNIDELLEYYHDLITSQQDTDADKRTNTARTNLESLERASGTFAKPDNTLDYGQVLHCLQCEKSHQAKCEISDSSPSCNRCSILGMSCSFSWDNQEYLSDSKNTAARFEAAHKDRKRIQTSITRHRMKNKVRKTAKSLSPNPVQYPRSSFFIGETSPYDIKLINRLKLDNIDQLNLSSTLTLRKVSPNVSFILKDDYEPNVYLRQEKEIDLVEALVYPYGKFLIEIFFKQVHPYMPILHESVFLEKYSRSHRELTAPLLASIYSLALQWWDFHPDLIGVPKPEVVEKLNDIAFETFFSRVERPKLSMVQTGLLILQCRSKYRNNWVLCSTVVALSEELGLGVDCQNWRLPKWEKSLRKRLAWAVWQQDKWTSLLESRLSHLIIGRNWMVPMINENDYPPMSVTIENSLKKNSMRMKNTVVSELDDVPLFEISPNHEDFINGVGCFKHSVSLSVILGEIMDTFYTQGASHNITTIEQVLTLAKPLQLKLKQWYQNLPTQYSMSAFIPRKFNFNGFLNLAYFAAELTLHRKIISTLSNDTLPEVAKVCRSAAKARLVAAIEFVRDLKNEHLSAFWYSCSTGNLTLIGTFCALLYTTSSSSEEALIYKNFLRSYIRIIRVRYKVFDCFEVVLSGLLVLLNHIPGLLTDDFVTIPSNRTKTQVHIADQNTAYSADLDSSSPESKKAAGVSDTPQKSASVPLFGTNYGSFEHRNTNRTSFLGNPPAAGILKTSVDNISSKKDSCLQSSPKIRSSSNGSGSNGPPSNTSV